MEISSLIPDHKVIQEALIVLRQKDYLLKTLKTVVNRRNPLSNGELTILTNKAAKGKKSYSGYDCRN
jgi:hypothetical protein